jgi:ribonucleotide reductase alpha subunit
MSFAAVRRLRIGDDTQAEKNDGNVNLFEKNRVLRIDFDPKVGDKVDRLHKVTEELSKLNQDHKKRVKSLEAAKSVLEKELLEYAQEEKVTTVMGRTAVVEYTSKTSRSIEPVKFLQFLKELGKGKRFWHYANIAITEPIKDFGENVLLSTDVLEVNVNPYGTLKTKLKAEFNEG